MTAIRAKLFSRRSKAPARVAPPELQAPPKPSRASTIDSLDRELQALGLDSAPSSPSSSEPPPYTETAQNGSIKVADGSAVCHGDKKSAADILSNLAVDTHALADPTTDELLAEEQLLDYATAFIDNAEPIPPTKSYPPLAKPVIVPRLNPGASIPFARGWAPVLEDQGISQEDFLTFLDNLNVVCHPPAAVKIMDVAAFGLSFVPLDFADGLGALLQVISAVTAAAISHARGKRYLARLNDGFFHPRGLHARVVGTRAMRRACGVPSDDPLVLPLGEATMTMTPQERCLRHLEQWTAALQTEGLPPPSPQTSLLSRLAAWQVRRRVREAAHWAGKSRRRAWKRVQKGKKPKERGGERWRVRMLAWVLVQNLEDYEREVEERQQEQERKRERRRRFFGKGKGKAVVVEDPDVDDDDDYDDEEMHESKKKRLSDSSAM